MSTTRDVAVPPGSGFQWQDYPRNVFLSPYFSQAPLGEIFAPAVRVAAEIVIPEIIAPFVQVAADNAVQNLAVQRAGDTMSGPLFFADPIPWQDSQAASKLYVDMMLATAGVPEVPLYPANQQWVREVGAWVPLPDSPSGFFLALSGGTMTGPINMGASPINNLAPVPVLPNGAAPATWVLDQIAARSLYQGTWQADSNYPDLTTPGLHQNGFTWIAVLNDPTQPVTVLPAIPGLQGQEVYNSDTIIFSSVAGQFQIVRAGGGITWPEAIASFLPLTGGSMMGPLMLAQAPVADLEAASRAWVISQIGSSAWADAPNDGMMYSRMHGMWALTANDPAFALYLPLTGGALSGALTLSGNATTNLGAVTLQQMSGAITSATSAYLPLTGGTLSGPLTVNGTTAVNGTLSVSQAATIGGALTLSGNASVPLQAVPLQQLNAVMGGYLPLAGGTLNGPGNLTVAGILSVGGTFGTESTASIGSTLNLMAAQVGDFFIGRNAASGNRVLSWSATGWNDIWSETTGLRAWSSPSGNIMSLNAAGNLNCAGGISCAGAVNAAYLAGGPGLAGTLRTWGGAEHRVTFVWNAPVLGFRIDEVQTINLPTQGNATNFGFAAGGGPVNVTLNASDMGGNLYGIFVDALCDQRIKENIEDTDVDALATILAVPVRQFDVKAEYAAHFAGIGKSDEECAQLLANARPVHVPIGLITQEVQPHVPEAVHVKPLGTNPDDPLPPNAQTLRENQFMPYVLRAIQQMMVRINALES